MAWVKDATAGLGFLAVLGSFYFLVYALEPLFSSLR